MQTILDILKKAGGRRPGLYLKIENPPFLPLVMEAMGEAGPCGLPAVSVARYGEQNGDAMRDPEMCVELRLAEEQHLSPFYYRNDFAGIEQWSRFLRNGEYVAHAMLCAQHERFAALWSRNLKAQGFVAAFTNTCICG